MFVGVAEIEVFIPHSGSLKAKRSVVNGLKGRIQSRFRVAIAEVGENDRWQRARVGVAIVGGDVATLEETLRSIRRVAEGVAEGQIVEFRSTVIPWSFEV